MTMTYEEAMAIVEKPTVEGCPASALLGRVRHVALGLVGRVRVETQRGHSIAAPQGSLLDDAADALLENGR